MLRWISRSLLFVFGSLVGAQLVLRALLRIRPQALPSGLSKLVSVNLRRYYRDPVRVMDCAGLHKNEVVLDAGCGNGVFSLEAARRVGDGGLVHVVDGQPSMIEATRKRFDTVLISNVKFHIASLTALPIDSETIDTTLMLSVLPSIANRMAALEEIKRVLKPGGELIVGEEFFEPEYVRPATTQRWVEQAGFQIIGRNGNGLAYLLKFIKPVTLVNIAASTSA
jgi:ubiquinone/menaquinone biosynthesis C-methylase UbiE